MRTIEFRGKTADGRWIYGNYNQIGVNHAILPKEGIFEFVTNYLIDPNTLGQYTGLKDKNGKEIYEGDIVNNGELVRMVHGIFEPVAYYKSEYLEVMGNIFENPELMEVEE